MGQKEKSVMRPKRQKTRTGRSGLPKGRNEVETRRSNKTVNRTLDIYFCEGFENLAE